MEEPVKYTETDNRMERLEDFDNWMVKMRNIHYWRDEEMTEAYNRID